MAIKSSYQTVAEQIIAYNTNAIELLSKLNELSLSSEPSLTVDVINKSGISTQLNLPSFGFLKSEIIRLNNNIESIYNINGSGALIQTSNNVYKKVITVDLNKEPNDITSIDSVANFTISKNWFFDSLLNPQLFIELDLSGKVEDNVTTCKARRYIIDFDEVGGELTSNGSSALSAFDSTYRNKSNIDLGVFVNWLLTTPGIKNAANVNYDEQDFIMEANRLRYNGQYSVLKVEEDTLNNILWYHLDTLRYVNTLDNSLSQLSIGMELILNVEKSSTRYKIIEISTSMVNPRVRLERIEGVDPIPVGIGTLKIYSSVFQNKKIRISVGYNERNVLFIKPINTDNHIMSKNWSGGIGYWTNDLKLKSGDSDNGMSMSQYYVSKVNDYGTVLRDLTKKNIPNLYAIKPIAPTLTLESFKVIQINKHLTDTNGSSALKAKSNQLVSLKSEIAQLNDAIISKNKQLITTRFTSESSKSQFENDLVKLNKKKESNSKLLGSLVSDIIAATNEVNSGDVAKYRLRGFWDIPRAATSVGTNPQEIVQFRVKYRYLTIDGREPATDTYNLSADGTRTTAVFSNWNTMLTEPRKRIYDVSSDTYAWEIVNVGDGNTINTNQLDISISPNESIEVMVQSISEVGYPESLVESDWSSSMFIEFPSELNVGTIDIETIKMAAIREDIKTQIESDFAAKGLDSHLADTTIVNNKTYDHKSDKILSGFKDSNNVDLDLFAYLKHLQSKIEQLEAKINKVSGELEVVMYRNNDQLVIKNGAEITYNVECEDYLDTYTDTGIQTGRVYANSIYVIKDFLLKIKNKSSQSPLGLLSGRDYKAGDIYNTSAPQTFWVNDQNELISSNITGQTKTQLNNQFIWMVNYEGITQSSAVKLSDSIGDNFVTNKSNSITNILASSDFNLGYSGNTVLSFMNNNNSLLDSTKWVDPSSSIASTTKLLSTVHPVTSDLDNIVEVNSDKVKVVGVNDNDDINIPLNIYFKMNALDNTKTGKDYQYVNLNNSTQSVKHIKKVKFLLESESDNRPFIFTVVFVLNRNKTIVKKTTSNVPSMTDSLQDVSTKQRKSKTSIYKPNIIQ